MPAKKKASDEELAASHRYVTHPGGSPAIGVTTVIGNLDKPFLAQAKAKQTAAIAILEGGHHTATSLHRLELRKKYDAMTPYMLAKWEREGWLVDLSDDHAVLYDWLRGEVERRWKAKADLGSRVHDHAYQWTLGNAVDALPDEKTRLDALELFYEECDPEFIPGAIERVVVHPYPDNVRSWEYGGRDDGFAILHRVPERFAARGITTGPKVTDYKTGGCYLEQLAMQLAAYANGLGFTVYDAKGMLTDLDPIPKVNQGVGIYLHEDGTYDLALVPIDRRVFAAFLDLRRVVNYRQSIAQLEKEESA